MTKEIFTTSREASADIQDEGIVILHVGQGRLYRSNAVGASIWRAIERQLPTQEIVNQVSHEFQVSSSVAREQSVRFISQLENQKLIHRTVAL